MSITLTSPTVSTMLAVFYRRSLCLYQLGFIVFLVGFVNTVDLVNVVDLFVLDDLVDLVDLGTSTSST